MSCEIANSACTNTGGFLDARIDEVLWSEGDAGCGKGVEFLWGVKKSLLSLVLYQWILHK